MRPYHDITNSIRRAFHFFSRPGTAAEAVCFPRAPSVLPFPGIDRGRRLGPAAVLGECCRHICQGCLHGIAESEIAQPLAEMTVASGCDICQGLLPAPPPPASAPRVDLPGIKSCDDGAVSGYGCYEKSDLKSPRDIPSCHRQKKGEYCLVLWGYLLGRRPEGD